MIFEEIEDWPEPDEPEDECSACGGAGFLPVPFGPGARDMEWFFCPCVPLHERVEG